MAGARKERRWLGREIRVLLEGMSRLVKEKQLWEGGKLTTGACYAGVIIKTLSLQLLLFFSWLISPKPSSFDCIRPAMCLAETMNLFLKLAYLILISELFSCKDTCH